MQSTLAPAGRMQLFYLALCAGLVICVALWLAGAKEQVVLAIQAPQSEENALPVYAQYTATQSLVLPRSVRISRLQVPLFVPSHVRGITVSLRQNEQVLEEWDYHGSVGAGLIQEANFKLHPPQALAGELGVHFIGKEGTSNQEEAIRVFTESADEAYPDGNYRIAGNNKKGDIGLSLYEEKSRLILLLEEWRTSPLEVLIKTGQTILTFIVLAALLSVLGNTAGLAKWRARVAG